MKTSRQIFSVCLITLLLFLNTLTAFAQSTKDHAPLVKPAETPNAEQPFDAIFANKSLNLINTDAASEKTTVKELQAALLILNKFQQQAKKCTDTNTLQLDKLNQRLLEITTPIPLIDQSRDKALTEEKKYLSDKKEELFR